MVEDMIKKVYNKFIKKWIKKNYKYLLTFLLYLMYQSNFLIGLFSYFGLNILNFKGITRIAFLCINDFIYIVLLFLIYKKEIKKGLYDLKNNFQQRTLLSLKCWATGCILMAISSFIVNNLLSNSISSNEEIIRQSIKLAPFYMLFTCSIIAPIFEELVFRKSLKEIIGNKWIFILVSGLSFGLLHVLSSYSAPLDLLYIIPYGSMGCCFAYLLTKTENITLPIIIHMIHNTILVLVQIIGG